MFFEKVVKQEQLLHLLGAISSCVFDALANIYSSRTVCVGLTHTTVPMFKVMKMMSSTALVWFIDVFLIVFCTRLKLYGTEEKSYIRLWIYRQYVL